MNTLEKQTPPPMPIVTLVTPVFNGAKYIRQTIESVLAQDYPHIEYIVIDDGSTDETPAILAEYAAWVQCISQQNQGPASTLSKGWSLGRGALLGYINADDVLFPSAVSKLVAIFMAQPDIAVAYPNMNMMDADGRLIKKGIAKPFDYTSLIVDQICCIGPGALFRRAVFERIGGWDPALRLTPDREFWMRVGRFGKFVMHEEVLANYRMHPGAISYYYMTEAGADEHIKIIEQYYQSPPLSADILQKKNIAFANAYIAASCAHLKGGRFKKCLQNLKKAKAFNPHLRFLPIARMFVRALLTRLIHQVTWIRIIAAVLYSTYHLSKQWLKKFFYQQKKPAS